MLEPESANLPSFSGSMISMDKALNFTEHSVSFCKEYRMFILTALTGLRQNDLWKHFENFKMSDDIIKQTPQINFILISILISSWLV